MKKVVAIIQARLNSTRLPNKVLLKIPPDSGITCLGRVIERVKNCTLVDDIVLTTPDRVLAANSSIKSKVYYGKRDVLKEFYEAAVFFNADIIVRITADCPMVDPEIIDQCIDEFLDSDVELVYNTDESNGQLNGEGSDVEIFSFDALQQAYNKAETPDDREHVTKWMRRNLKTKFVPMKKMGIMSLNTYEDYVSICKIYGKEEKRCKV